MTISAISSHSGLNSLLEYIWVVLKLHCSYKLLSCLIPSSIFFNFRFLIIPSIYNRMCQDIVLRNPMPLMCMISQYKVKCLHLSRIFLGKIGTTIGSTCRTLWRSVLYYKFFTLGPYIYSDILVSSHRIGRFCRMLCSVL